MDKMFLIILSIILLVILFFGGAFIFLNSKCDHEGSISWSSKNGFYCKYIIIIEDTESDAKCPDCQQFCQLKGKSNFIINGQPTVYIPLSSMEKLPNGSLNIQKGSAQCFCNCK